jgi:G3E family GTPase
MNEFGEIAIDSRILVGENVQIVELAGGCVCCELTGEFEAAVREIVGTVRPEYIVVEATGVAESDALVYEVEDNIPEVRLDSVVCIVDAYLGTRHPEIGHTARTHLQAADVVLVNKIDLVAPDDVEKVEAQVKRYNDRALLLKTVGCDVDVGLLLGVTAGGERSFPRERGGAVTPLESFTFTTERHLDMERFQAAMSRLPESVYRAKGFVRFPGGTFLFNYVTGRADLEEFPADTTQLVFIGREIGRVREEIVRGLSDCMV